MAPGLEELLRPVSTMAAVGEAGQVAQRQVVQRVLVELLRRRPARVVRRARAPAPRELEERARRVRARQGRARLEQARLERVRRLGLAGQQHSESSPRLS